MVHCGLSLKLLVIIAAAAHCALAYDFSRLQSLKCTKGSCGREVTDDKSEGCCEKCCGCCVSDPEDTEAFWECKGTPCWGCKNSNATPPNQQYCAKTKPKSNPKCKCNPEGIVGVNTPRPSKDAMCYECKGCSSKERCYFCGQQCKQKTDDVSFGYSVEWTGENCLIRNFTATKKLDEGGYVQDDECQKACGAEKDCWKFNTRIPSKSEQAKYKSKTFKAPCALFKDCAVIAKVTGKDRDVHQAAAFYGATVPKCWAVCG